MSEVAMAVVVLSAFATRCLGKRLGGDDELNARVQGGVAQHAGERRFAQRGIFEDSQHANLPRVVARIRRLRGVADGRKDGEQSEDDETHG